MCLTLVLETPVLRSSEASVACLELGPIPGPIRGQDVAQGGSSSLSLALDTQEQRAVLDRWLAEGQVVLRFPSPGRQSEADLLSSAQRPATP
jgi:hypothetical protein